MQAKNTHLTKKKQLKKMHVDVEEVNLAMHAAIAWHYICHAFIECDHREGSKRQRQHTNVIDLLEV